MTDSDFEVDVTVDKRVAMPTGYESSEINLVVESVLRAEGASGPWEISIAFADDEELRELHREYLDDDTPTDIMTFPFETDGDWAGVGEVVKGGDIAISVDRAAEQAVDGGWDTVKELKFLVAHGVLHLLGWDDSSAELRTRMLDRQREILAEM